MPDTDASLYQRVMGESFSRLAPALQRFHNLRGHQMLQGRVRTEAPVGWAARLLARALGTPLQASAGAIRFELFAQASEERWVRHFPQQGMSSVMRLQQGRIVEQLGAARLEFELAEVSGTLQMRLQRMHFFGLPCPRWLQPRILAEERGDGDRLLFHIRAEVPGLGLVSAYRGHLELRR